MSDDIMISLHNAHTYSKSCNRQRLCRLVGLVEQAVYVSAMSKGSNSL